MPHLLQKHIVLWYDNLFGLYEVAVSYLVYIIWRLFVESILFVQALLYQFIQNYASLTITLTPVLVSSSLET